MTPLERAVEEAISHCLSDCVKCDRIAVAVLALVRRERAHGQS